MMMAMMALIAQRDATSNSTSIAMPASHPASQPPNHAAILPAKDTHWFACHPAVLPS